MKKLAALLTLSLILSMSACNTSSNEPSGSSSAGSSEEEIVIKFGYTPGDLPPEESREVAYATAFKEYVEANSCLLYTSSGPAAGGRGGQPHRPGLSGLCGGYVPCALYGVRRVQCGGHLRGGGGDRRRGLLCVGL